MATIGHSGPDSPTRDRGINRFHSAIQLQSPSQMTQVEEDIVSYLLDHPEARDTLDGIVRWWVLELRIQREIRQVEQAVAELVQRGWLISRTGADAQVHYSLNSAKAEEIAVALGREVEP